DLVVAGVLCFGWERPNIRDPIDQTNLAAINGAKDLVREQTLNSVNGHEHLVAPHTNQPQAIAVVALKRAAVPRLTAVGKKKQRVVREVNTNVVDAPAGILRQIQITEAHVLRRVRREAAAEVVALPSPPTVVREPHVDLVAVAREERERHLKHKPKPINMH